MCLSNRFLQSICSILEQKKEMGYPFVYRPGDLYMILFNKQ